jgi:hypothetical protein
MLFFGRKRIPDPGSAVTILVALGCLGFAGSSAAQDAEIVQQKLDRVDVFSSTSAQGIIPEPISFGVAGAGITACQNTATAGLYCLDNGSVRRWPDPEKFPTPLQPVVSETLFTCANPDLGLDRGGVCTAMTVDRMGHIWLAGKRKSAFSLLKVVRKDGSACRVFDTDAPGDPAWKPLRGTNYCAREYASGRPLLVDLSVVNEDTVPFPYGAGVLALENRGTAVFFQDDIGAVPVVLGSGTRTWGNSNQDPLQGITLLQRNDQPVAKNWLLVTTASGRVLAKEVSWDGSATRVFPVMLTNAMTNAVSLAVPDAASTCSGTLQEPLFAIRTSARTGQVFATDRRGCRAVSMVPSFATATSAPTFSAPAIEAANLPAPEGLSVAPGIDVDLRKCGGPSGTLTCTLIPDTEDPVNEPNSFAAAELTAVELEGDAYGMVVFQIRNIPDCRFIPASVRPTICDRSGVIPNPTAPPEQQYLDVAKLLPEEITSLYTASLPPMLVSPLYSARPDLGFYFDALFGKTDDEVQFRNRFTANFDIGDLLGPGRAKLGCGGAYVGDSGTALAPQPNTAWDVLLTISERFPTVGGPTGTAPNHMSMLINADPCTNPAAGAGSRWSIYTYGMRLTPTKSVAGNLVYADSVFATLLSSLAADLGATLDQYVCTNAISDGGTGTALGAPVTAAACSTLKSSWSNTEDKLAKCIMASTDPKTSAGAQTCQAFRTQFASFSSTVDSTLRSGQDYANRVGELKARKDVLFHVFDKHFYPSIPDGGFNDM